MKKTISILALIVLGGCAVAPPSTTYVVQRPIQTVQLAPIVSVYVEPLTYQPPPIAVAWAPPPMLVEIVPLTPFASAVWVGGYWVWNGNWVWAHGRWSAPPQPDYGWVNPYYEHRAGRVVFIDGFWAAPGVSFQAPAIGLPIALATVTVGVSPGPRPIGPEGIFVPAPPGSRVGLIVPAPLGTAPAVVTSAPPVVSVGMRIVAPNSNVNVVGNRIGNVSNVSNVTNVTNITNVMIVAPASATASGQAVNASVPAQAHLAAALPSVVRAPAPPVSVHSMTERANAQPQRPQSSPSHAAPVATMPGASRAIEVAPSQPSIAGGIPGPVKGPVTAAEAVRPMQPVTASVMNVNPVTQHIEPKATLTQSLDANEVKQKPTPVAVSARKPPQPPRASAPAPKGDGQGKKPVAPTVKPKSEARTESQPAKEQK